jgi:hypothetical protein
VEREVREADDAGYERCEERKAEMLGDEGGPGGEECGVEELFDAGGVDSAVFYKRMVAGQGEGEEGEERDGKQAGLG